VRVAVEREQAAGLQRVGSQRVVDVLAMPVAVDLDRDPAFGCRIEHAAPVGADARTGVEHPPSGMTEDRDRRGADGGQHPVGLIFSASQLRMRRGHHELEHAPLRLQQVERTVGENIRLDPLEDAEAAGVPGVDRVDLEMLPAHGLHAHAVRDRQPVRMVGDPEALMTAREACLHHGLERLRPVAPRRVHLEVAAEVGRRDDVAGNGGVEYLAHHMLAQESLPQSAHRLELRPLAGGGRSLLHRRRPAGLEELLDDANAGRPDERHLAQAARPREIADRLTKRDDRLGGPLVPELTSLRRLQERHVVEEPRGGDVLVFDDEGVAGGATGTRLCNQRNSSFFENGRSPSVNITFCSTFRTSARAPRLLAWTAG